MSKSEFSLHPSVLRFPNLWEDFKTVICHFCRRNESDSNDESRHLLRKESDLAGAKDLLPRLGKINEYRKSVKQPISNLKENSTNDSNETKKPSLKNESDDTCGMCQCNPCDCTCEDESTKALLNKESGTCHCSPCDCTCGAESVKNLLKVENDTCRCNPCNCSCENVIQEIPVTFFENTGTSIPDIDDAEENSRFNRRFDDSKFSSRLDNGDNFSYVKKPQPQPVKATLSVSGNIVSANSPLWRQVESINSVYDDRPPNMN